MGERNKGAVAKGLFWQMHEDNTKTHPEGEWDLRTAIAALLTLLIAALPLLQPLDDQPARQHDLREIARTIERHEWGLGASPQRLAAFRYLAQKDIRLAAAPMPYWRYFGLAASLIASVRNPHTMIWPDMHEHLFLPVWFYWASDGLVTVPIVGGPKGIALGDRVLSIGGKSPATLARELQRYFPGSSYDVRSTASRFDLLGARYSLEWLGVVNQQDRVPITLETAQGTMKRLQLEFAAAPRLQSAATAFFNRFVMPRGLSVTTQSFAWRVVRRRYGVFWLGSFEPSATLTKSIQRFFKTVATEHVQNIVLDVQQDPGGNGSVVEQLIQTLEQPKFMTRHIYVMTDWGSFSASVLLAEEVLSLNLGEVVGQPTGENLELNGEENFQAPQTGIWYQVAVTAPMDPLQRRAPTLRPNISVPLTVEDIQQGRNAIADWLSTLGSPKAAR